MKREQTPQPDDTIYLCLTEPERKLLLSMIALPPEFDDRLGEAASLGGEPAIQLTLEELDLLTDAIAAEANHATSRRRERELDQLFDRIAALFDVYSDDEAMEMLRNTDFSEDALPMPGLGDVSALQLTYLLVSDWDDPKGAVRINESLTAEDLGGVPILANVRTLLSAALESGGVKATVAKNLNRKFIREMIMAFVHDPETPLETWLQFKNPLNEEDVWPVHIAHVLCSLAGLIRCIKGVHRVTKKGKTLLDDSRQGALFALLFKTFYRKLDLDYYSYHTEGPVPQRFIPYFLYRTQHAACEWTSQDDFIANLMPPALHEEADELEVHFTAVALEFRLIRPLARFGLLERRRTGQDERGKQRFEVRKSELFDRFLTFVID